MSRPVLLRRPSLRPSSGKLKPELAPFFVRLFHSAAFFRPARSLSPSFDPERFTEQPGRQVFLADNIFSFTYEQPQRNSRIGNCFFRTAPLALR